jgi:hypothetical protein
MSTQSVIAGFVSAAVTFLAIIVALFRDEIRRLWQRPKLTAKIDLEPPDCHKTRISVVHVSTGAISAGTSYYFRLWIENAGNIRADRVQVFASRLWKKDLSGSYLNEERFLPMNLCWSHAANPQKPEIYAEGISPSMGKHCDLGHILNPDLRKAISEFPEGTPPESNCLVLDLEVKPNTMTHLLPAGEYRLEIKIGSSNARPISKIIAIRLSEKWNDDERKMFTDGISINMTH